MCGEVQSWKLRYTEDIYVLLKKILKRNISPCFVDKMIIFKSWFDPQYRTTLYYCTETTENKKHFISLHKLQWKSKFKRYIHT